VAQQSAQCYRYRLCGRRFGAHREQRQVDYAAEQRNEQQQKSGFRGQTKFVERERQRADLHEAHEKHEQADEQ